MLRNATRSSLLYALLLPLMGSAHAADLSTRYTDSNGDMVADAPTDETKWVDPSTLIFAYTPVEDPAVYAKVWDGFLQHMEKVTGKKIKFFPVQSNAAQLEAMRAGRLHIAGFNTGSVPLAVNCAGFVPFTMMADKAGNYGYQMEIITHNGSGIDDVAGLRGHTLAFTSPTSNSGFKAPSALLKSEFNLEADKDFKTAFSGKHDNSIMGVVNRDYDAAAIANSVLAQMQARGMVKPDQYKVLYTSQTFPTTGYGYVYNLKPELAEKIRQGFETFDWEGSALQAEFKSSDGEQFIPITYQKHWEVVRKIDQAMDVSYSCDK
ncbi:phosphate/phosphite/phosphonate ABC transporter substrate-binding protein [Pseudomonas seleniipraecipitans]|uniref:Phosphate/phosphite/phosphonate ABC transporter substrate-binding protein n=1 Tax=Phytopseudomonas seleniipraecipitans TaxID=640205 RepID=A0ABY5J4C2_9GAMM|nr:phosphate/phosphite/phosphonate ABC transporter substrate-binding protein [Pseudomonas seleniipraecipitans]UUD62396.1 phosphate/phosphite/phosphonate ABC transporter substrate-binding protein [Pseudomonas seleniipraecipitans]